MIKISAVHFEVERSQTFTNSTNKIVKEKVLKFAPSKLFFFTFIHLFIQFFRLKNLRYSLCDMHKEEELRSG